MSTAPHPGQNAFSTRPFIVTGVVALVLLLGGVGGWSALAELAGAVIASGELRKESNRQVVQHADGGIVADILVGEGEPVAAGDVLLRLDGTTLRAERAIIDAQLDEALATIARLEAERDGAFSMTLPTALRARMEKDAELRSIVTGQRKLFSARFESLEAEKVQLARRVEQIEQRIEGADRQIASLLRQSELIADEVVAQEALFEKGLARSSPLSALQREEAALEGEIARQRAAIAEARSEIAETEVALLQLDNVRREEAIDRLRSLQAEIAGLRQQRIAVADRLQRMDIRAPRAGVVEALAVHARQSVIQPAEPLLYIVPENEALIVEIEVAPTDIDSVHRGQKAELRFPAFNARTTPSIPGHVRSISADRRIDEQSGESFYAVEIAMEKGALGADIAESDLLPGMPVEAYLKTESRTPISYLTRPLTDQLARAMREE